jgi:hypothetical protein
MHKHEENKMPDDWEPTSMGGGDGWKLNILKVLIAPFSFIFFGVLFLKNKLKK